MIGISNSSMTKLYRFAFSQTGDKSKALDSVLGGSSDKSSAATKSSSVPGMDQIMDKLRRNVSARLGLDAESQNTQSTASSGGAASFREKLSSRISAQQNSYLSLDEVRTQQAAKLQQTIDKIKSNPALAEDKVSLSLAALQKAAEQAGLSDGDGTEQDASESDGSGDSSQDGQN